MVKNHRRALAGYSSNTINIDSHVDVVGLVALWSIIWFIQKVFDVNNNVDDGDDDANRQKEDVQTHGMTIISNICTHGLSCFIEIMIVLLICKRSVGQSAIDRLWWFSFYYTFAFSICIACICFLDPGARSDYWPPYRHLQTLYNVQNLFKIIVYLMAIYYCRETGITNERPDGHRFLLYMIRMNTVFVISGVLLESRHSETVNAGICGWDLVNIYRFATFAPWVYYVLKRDCQYWGLDIAGADDEEEVSLLQSTNDAAWQEGASYQDIVIPKTAIYFRKKLEQHFDTTVELHFWRRRLVIVKRFQFDFLSRENIKCFKQEANIFRKLEHPNIVKFFGVVIDPPSLGIVMQYAVNGDLFKYLEAKRGPHRIGRNKNNSNSTTGDTDSFTSSAVDVGEIGMYDESTFEDRRQSAQNMTNNGSFAEGGVMGMIMKAKDSFLGRSQSRTPTRDGASGSGTRSGSRLLGVEGLLSSSSPASSRTASRDNQPSRVGFRASLVNLASGGTPSIQPFHPIRCALQVAKGMAYLHSNDILHRDMKSLNILLDENFCARIADFGESVFVAPTPDASIPATTSVIARRPVRKAISRWKQQQSLTGTEGTAASFAYDSTIHKNLSGESVGTPGWGAPEALMGIGSSRLSDVFGFGIILWELLTWRAPSVLITRDILDDPKLCKALGLNKNMRGVPARVQAVRSKAGTGATQDSATAAVPIAADSSNITTTVSMAMAASPFSFSLTQSDFGGASVMNNDVFDEAEHVSGGTGSNWRTPPPLDTVEKHNRVEMTVSNDSQGSVEAQQLRRNEKALAAAQRNTGSSQTGMRPDDLILVEVSNMSRAVELMCDRKLRPPVPVGLPRHLTNLLTRCWHFDPKQRPDFTEIITILEDFQCQSNLMLLTSKHFSLKGAVVCVSSATDNL